MHGRELQTLAEQLDAHGERELAERLRLFRGLQNDEVGVAVRELEDLLGGALPESLTLEESPKRAQWVEEEQPQPMTRRELLNLGGESEPD